MAHRLFKRFHGGIWQGTHYGMRNALAVYGTMGIINFFSGAYICQAYCAGGLRFLPKVQEAADRGCGKRRSRSDFPFQRF